MIQPDQHSLIQPTVNEDTFTSKTFLVRYCEESIELNDVI